MAGKTLRIPAVVTGRPVPTKVWTIEEGELDKERVVIENVGTKSELIIKNALRKDHGRYVITATNSCGSKFAAARVEVFGKERSGGLTGFPPTPCNVSLLHYFRFVLYFTVFISQMSQVQFLTSNRL